MKREDKEKKYCENLRIMGKSYTEIQKACEEKFNYKPSKGLLSNWLRNIMLTEEQQKEIAKRGNHRNYISAYKGAQTNKRKKQERIAETKAAIDYKFDTDQHLKSVGLSLYWGEGTKNCDNIVAMSNSDPVIHQLFLQWLEECYGVDRKNVKCQLHIHEDLDYKELLDFWSIKLGLEKNQFTKPYIKPNHLDHRKNKLYQGTLQIRYYNTQLHYQIMFEIEEIKKHFSGNTD